VRKLTLSLAILAAMMPGQGYPLGLGEIELNSALNQELDAEIKVLSAQPEDAEQLIIKLASREAFARAGIDRPFLLQQLKFKTVVKDGEPHILIRTKKPIREPFLSFLVEIDWPQGHLLREYTLLLDPPVYTGGKAAGTPAAGGEERPFIDPADQTKTQSVNSDLADEGRPVESSYDTASATHSSGVVATEEADGSVSYTAAAPQFKEVSGEYRVQANDTLWSLSNQMRPDSSVSVEQMMLALVRHNPEAFIQQNINGVKRGYILRMPDRAAITSVDRQEALAQVREQSALWRQYREAQSGVVPASSLESELDAPSGDTAADAAVDGQLSIVSASETDGSDTATAGQDPNADTVKQLRNQLALARESLESERLEKDDLRTRLSELETRVQNVLQMDESELAKLQDDLKGVQQDAEPAPVEEEPVEEVVTEETPVEEVLVDDAPAEEVVAETVEDATTEDEEAVTEDGAEKPAEDALFVDETTQTEDQPVTEEVISAPMVDEAGVPAFVQPEKPKSFTEKLLDDPSMLAAIGGGLLGVFALIGILLRRRRVNKSDDEWIAGDDDLGGLDEIADSVDETVKTDAVDMEATGEMDLGATSEMTGANDAVPDFDDTHIEAPADDDLEQTVISLDDEPVAEAEEERDDVLAEADVYLAYGIYQQAEELLNSAINQNPERDDYRMKLLETHFAGKNGDAFAVLAAETHQRKGSDKSYWDRVVAMGRDLCPGNDLFIGGGSIPELDDLIPEKPQTTDLELDAGDGDATPDFDLGLDVDEPDSDATQILDAPADLDLGLPEEDVAESGSVSDEVGDLVDDSELEFDLGDFGEELEEASDSIAEAPAEEISLDEELGDLELGMDDLEVGLDESADDDASLDIDEDFSLDFEASDLGFDEETEESSTEEISMDLDEDLDLSEDLGMDLDTSDAEADVSLGDDGDDFDISALSEDVDEVSTKLDLAKAYIDMGDSEGARSILEEVKEEGNDEQQQQADDLLKQAS
jgi:pilus assembly protein FimV